MDNEQLRPCPWCGKDPAKEWHSYQGGTVEVACANPDCPMMEVTTGVLKPDKAKAAWNTRPIEDALRAEVARLTADLASEQRWANEYHQQAERLQAELQHDIWHQVEECMPNTEEMVFVVDVDIVRRGFWQYHGLDVEWRTADNRLIEVYWWKALPKLPWDGEK